MRVHMERTQMFYTIKCFAFGFEALSVLTN